MFKKVFKLFLLFSMVAKSYSTHAQRSMVTPNGSSIGGVLLDSITRRPIAFATLILKNRNNQKFGGMSDNRGSFRFDQIKPAIYSLQISYIGYHSKIFPGLTIVSNSSVDLDTILLVVDKKSLQIVDVTAHTNLVEDKGDKIVYHAESDINNAGGNALDVLRKTPVVSVDASGSVQMLGSESIKILLNGKSFSASSSNVGDALKMIPANTIRSVEIITSPSSKYDAEGTGGVLNIITRKHQSGSNASVGLTGGNLVQNVSSTYSFQGERIGINFDGSYGRKISEGKSSFERVNDTEGVGWGSLLQRNQFNNTNRSWEADLGVAYDFDSLNNLSFSIAHWGQDDPIQTSLYSNHDFSNQPNQEYWQDIDFSNPFGNVSANLAYTHQFKNDKQALEVISQYSNTYDDYQYSIDRYEALNSLSYRELSKNNSKSREWTLQADYSQQFDTAGRRTIELGVKTIVRDMNSDYQVDESTSGTIERLAVNPSLSDVFDYRQGVLSAYSTFKANTRSGWLFLAGARLEHTIMEGTFKSSSSSFKNDYFNFLPSITISKKINGKHTIKASFTERLLRPQVWNLNPYIIPTDPYNISKGNPQLRPELSHLAQVGFSTSTSTGVSFNSNIYWRHSDNAMQSIITVEPDGKAISFPENAGRHRRLGLTVNASSEINKRWSFSTNLEGYNAYLKSNLIDFSNRGWFFRSSLNTAIRLPQKYTLQLFGNYSSGTITLQRKSKETYFYSVSLRKDFLKGKASATLNIENPFNSYNVQEAVDYAEDFQTYRINKYMNRSFRLSLHWKFGKSFGKEKTVKKINNDDNSGR